LCDTGQVDIVDVSRKILNDISSAAGLDVIPDLVVALSASNEIIFGIAIDVVVAAAAIDNVAAAAAIDVVVVFAAVDEVI
jgi:hypothetical protein